MLRLNPVPRAGQPPWALAWRLAAGQIVAWGVLYYAFTVIVGPMQAATGWSRAFLHAGVTVGFLAWGLCAYPAGVWIHRRGARGLMTAASVVGGFALALIGLNPAPVGYLLAWMLLGVAMAGLLYEPAFAVVTARFGIHYQKGVTVITLVGGLASTVFIPAAQGLVGLVGWQQALVILGAFHAVCGAALHWFVVPPPSEARPDADHPLAPSMFRAWSLAEWRDRRFVGLALWFAAHAAAFSGTMMLLVPVIQQTGLANERMLAAIMLIGPMQVAGRLVLMVLIGRQPALRLARWAMIGLIASLALVTFFRPTFAVLAVFAVLYGAANGVMTVLRGTAVAEVFGRDRYALLSGALALPSVLAKAAAPLVLAALWEWAGDPRVVFGGALVLASAGVAGVFGVKPRPEPGVMPMPGPA